MGAKLAAVFFALPLLIGGCADLARFAPPGFVKYEDLAGDQPPNPQIQERIAEREAAGASKTPRLSEQPQETPKAIGEAEKSAILVDLRTKREALNAAVAADRAAATGERGGVVLPGPAGAEERTPEEAAEILSRAIERDQAAARAERAQPAPQADDEREE